MHNCLCNIAAFRYVHGKPFIYETLSTEGEDVQTAANLYFAVFFYNLQYIHTYKNLDLKFHIWQTLSFKCIQCTVYIFMCFIYCI